MADITPQLIGFGLGILDRHIENKQKQAHLQKTLQTFQQSGMGDSALQVFDPNTGQTSQGNQAPPGTNTAGFADFLGAGGSRAMPAQPAPQAPPVQTNFLGGPQPGPNTQPQPSNLNSALPPESRKPGAEPPVIVDDGSQPEQGQPMPQGGPQPVPGKSYNQYDSTDPALAGAYIRGIPVGSALPRIAPRQASFTINASTGDVSLGIHATTNDERNGAWIEWMGEATRNGMNWSEAMARGFVGGVVPDKSTYDTTAGIMYMNVERQLRDSLMRRYPELGTAEIDQAAARGARDVVGWFPDNQASVIFAAQKPWEAAAIEQAKLDVQNRNLDKIQNIEAAKSKGGVLGKTAGEWDTLPSRVIIERETTTANALGEIIDPTLARNLGIKPTITMYDLGQMSAAGELPLQLTDAERRTHGQWVASSDMVANLFAVAQDLFTSVDSSMWGRFVAGQELAWDTIAGKEQADKVRAYMRARGALAGIIAQNYGGESGGRLSDQDVKRVLGLLPEVGIGTSVPTVQEMRNIQASFERSHASQLRGLLATAAPYKASDIADQAAATEAKAAELEQSQPIDNYGDATKRINDTLADMTPEAQTWIRGEADPAIAKLFFDAIGQGKPPPPEVEAAWNNRARVP